jgi:hypothetical protein
MQGHTKRMAQQQTSNGVENGTYRRQKMKRMWNRIIKSEDTNVSRQQQTEIDII